RASGTVTGPRSPARTTRPPGSAAALSLAGSPRRVSSQVWRARVSSAFFSAGFTSTVTQSGACPPGAGAPAALWVAALTGGAARHGAGGALGRSGAAEVHGGGQGRQRLADFRLDVQQVRGGLRFLEIDGDGAQHRPLALVGSEGRGQVGRLLGLHRLQSKLAD